MTGNTKNGNNEVLLLEKLKMFFYRGSFNFILQPEDIDLMTWNWQQQFLDATVNCKLLQTYPTSRQFTRLFLKKIIEYLEGTQEVHDDFYSNLCRAMHNDGKEDSFSYRHYLIQSQKEIITMKETNKMVVNGTTGMRTWEAALMLADWALSHKEVFAHKHILELGSGVGFTGITIGKLCQPKCMHLSDCHPEVIGAICDNIRINFPESEVSDSGDETMFRNEDRIIGVMHLDWNSLEDLPNDIEPDVLIGADIVYDPSILEPLCEVLKMFFDRNNQLQVYIASVIRNEETFKSFLKHLENMKFTYQKLPQHQSQFIEWDHTIERCLLKVHRSH